MKLQLAALIATSVIAIVAAVFAIWPAVGHAPSEDDPPPTYCKVLSGRLREATEAGEMEIASIIVNELGLPEGCWPEG